MTAPISIDVPWTDSLTAYDRAHVVTYLRLLDAVQDHASVDEMARVILMLDPGADPEGARKAVEAHIRRAQWLAQHSDLLSR